MSYRRPVVASNPIRPATRIGARSRSLATVMLLVSFVVAGLRIEPLVLALSRSGRAGKIAA
jgi:hypothetical protein